MKLLLFKVIAVIMVCYGFFIESSESPQSSKQVSQQAQISPRLLPFLESLASPNDFMRPLPSNQECWRDFNNTDYTIPALMDVALRKKAAILMELILSLNPDIRTIKTESNQNVFHRLAEYGPAVNMRRLITYCKKHNYDLATLVNEQDKFGATPAHLAAKSCKTHCLDLLIENGADLNAQDQQTLTPLHYAEVTKARGNKKRNHVIQMLRKQ